MQKHVRPRQMPLGLFRLPGELEKIPTELHHRIEDALLKVYNSSDETFWSAGAPWKSLGYSGRDEVNSRLLKAGSR